MSYAQENAELRQKIDSKEPFMVRGHGFIKPRSNDKKQVDDWTRDDKEVRKVLMRAFPKLATDDRHRCGAARWVRVIHLYFRVHMTRQQVVDEMIGSWPEITRGIVGHIVRDARQVAKGLTSNSKERHPDNRGGTRPGAGRPTKSRVDHRRQLLMRFLIVEKPWKESKVDHLRPLVKRIDAS